MGYRERTQVNESESGASTADGRVERARQLCTDKLLEPKREEGMTQNLLSEQISVDVFSLRIIELVRKASPNVQDEVARSFAHHELRFLLCVTLPLERLYGLLRSICKQA